LFSKKVSARRFQETIKAYREKQARDAISSRGNGEKEQLGPVTEIVESGSRSSDA
jgi:hypothetical protein